jgi:hypothetical protein
MGKSNQIIEHSSDFPNKETLKEKTVLGGATKKCAYCGEEIPEKIAFCLYCMKSTTENSEDKPKKKFRGSTDNSTKKKPVILFIGLATLALVAVIATTSIITANIMLRHSVPNNLHLQTHATTPIELNQNQQNPPAPSEDAVLTSPGDVVDHTTPNVPGLHEVETLTLSSEGMFDHITPRSPQRQGGPANPAITATRAVELAHDHLLAMGITNARFDYVYMDLENGVWVWSVEFELGDRDFEFYVNVDSGAFLKNP